MATLLSPLGPEYKLFGGVASKAVDGVYATVALGGGPGTAVGDSGETGFPGPIDGFYVGIVATGVTTGLDLKIESLLPNIAGDTTERWVTEQTFNITANLAFGATGSLETISLGFNNNPCPYPKKIRASVANRVDGTVALYWLPFRNNDYNLPR